MRSHPIADREQDGNGQHAPCEAAAGPVRQDDAHDSGVGSMARMDSAQQHDRDCRVHCHGGHADAQAREEMEVVDQGPSAPSRPNDKGQHGCGLPQGEVPSIGCRSAGRTATPAKPGQSRSAAPCVRDAVLAGARSVVTAAGRCRSPRFQRYCDDRDARDGAGKAGQGARASRTTAPFAASVQCDSERPAAQGKRRIGLHARQAGKAGFQEIDAKASPQREAQ